jgi:hypothetical protein
LAIFNHFRMALVTLYGLTNSFFTLIFITPYRDHVYDNLIYPIAKALRLKVIKPRRTSTTWVSNTKRVERIMTVARCSAVLSV